MGTFQERLIFERNRHGISQQELAKSVGITRTAINNYEAGARKPSYEILCRIADYFDCTTDYLLGRLPLRNYEKKDLITKDGKQVSLAVRKGTEITPEYLEKVMDYEKIGVSPEYLEEILNALRPNVAEFVKFYLDQTDQGKRD